MMLHAVLGWTSGRGRTLAAFLGALLMALALACPLDAGEVPDNLTWQSMVQKIAQGLNLRAAGLDVMRRETRALVSSLQAEIVRSSNHFNQVQLLRNVSGDTPWAVRSILLQLNDLHEDLSLQTQPLAQLKEQLIRSRGDDAIFLDIQRDMTAEASSAFDLTALGPILDHLQTIREQEETVLKEADAGLASAAGLLARIETAKGLGQQRFIEVLADYYFETCESILTVAGRFTVWSEFYRWRNDFPQFLSVLANWVRWSEAFWNTVVVFVLLYWGLPALWQRLRQRDAAKAQASHRIGPFLCSLGLATVIAFRIGLFTLNQFTSLGAVVLLTLGLAVILTDSEPGVAPHGGPGWRGGSLLLTLWALFAVGALLQATNIPATALGVFSAVLCGVTAWGLHVVRAKDGYRCHAASCRLAVVFLAVLTILAPFGLGPQTIMLSQALFMLLLTMRAMDVVKRRLFALETVTQDGQKPVHLALMAYPFAASVLAFLFVAWLFMFIGGPGFLQYMLTKQWTLGGMSLNIESLGLILILFFALRLVMAWIKVVAVHARFGGIKLNTAMAHTVNATVSYVAWTVFTLVSFHLLGVQMSSLTWIASGLSVGVGFGLKDIVNNFISGLIILFGGSIKKGDVIQQGKNLGEVIDVSVRNTTIRTPDNTMVIIPNSTFLRGEIVNLSYQDAKTRLTIPVTVVPGTKVKKVVKLLLAAAGKNANVLKTPPPEASLVRFGKLGLEFELYVWIENFLVKFDTEAQLVMDIDRRFQEEVVTLAFQGAKFKYKPKGKEEQALESQREVLRQKRKEFFSRVRPLRRVYARARWNIASVPSDKTGE